MTGEEKRDLHEDLVWIQSMAETAKAEPDRLTRTGLIVGIAANASDGWPHAIRRAIAAEGLNEKLRTALTNLVTTVCRESCGHEAPIGKDGYPACSSPCKELTEALELLRPKEASTDGHQG